MQNCQFHLIKSWFEILHFYFINWPSLHPDSFNIRSRYFFRVNPLVHDTRFSERQDEPFSLQIQQFEVDLKSNADFYFLHPGLI